MQRVVAGDRLMFADHPSPAHRLRRLRLELDGLVYGDSFGLFELDRTTRTLKPTRDNSLREGERAVVCLHGMEELVLPEEIRDGDLCVTLDSATLEGAAAVHTKKIRHNRLPRDAEWMERVVELLVAEEWQVLRCES